MDAHQAGGHPRRGLRRLAALAGACLVAVLQPAGGAPERGSRDPSVRTAAAAERVTGRKATKGRRSPRLFQPRILPVVIPSFQAIAEPDTAMVGGRVLVTVRLVAGQGAARHAAVHVGADPSLLRYLGVRATGRGALIAEPSSVDGELVVYRSSLPEGFAQSEAIVEIEYEALAPGSCSIVLTGVRLMDGRARDLRVTYDAASLVIE